MIIDPKIEVLKVAQGIFGNTTPTELIVISALSLIVLAATLAKLSSIFSIPIAGIGRGFIVALLSLAAGLATLVAVNVYGLPLVKAPEMKQYLPWFALLASFVLIAAPAMCLIQKARYIKALMTLILSYVITAVIALALQSGIDSVRKGALGVDTQKKEGDRGVDAVLSK